MLTLGLAPGHEYICCGSWATGRGYFCCLTSIWYGISRILKQMISFRLLLFVPSPVLEVSSLECSRSGCVCFVLGLVVTGEWLTTCRGRVWLCSTNSVR